MCVCVPEKVRVIVRKKGGRKRIRRTEIKLCLSRMIKFHTYKTRM